MGSAPDHVPGVTAAQFHSFARRMPSYYLSVIAMMIGVIIVFHALAPFWLACVLPTFILLLGASRGVWWVQHRNDQVTDEHARKLLRRATVTLVTSAAVVLAMDARLYFYGDIYARVFLLIQILASATCGFYCLMHLRTAAFATFAAIMLPFAALTFLLGHLSTSVSAITSLITAGVMISAMLGYERDFLSLIRAKAETSELSRENLRLAHIDMLTGLPNRRYFFEHVETCTPGRGEQELLPTVGIIDLDGFKPVNDTYGHRTGDRVLQEIAARLTRLDVGMQHLCRLGGDEFVFLTEATDPDALQQLGRAIATCIGESISLDQRVICVGSSVGFAIQDAKGKTDGFELFEQADYALYHAKRTGRARTVLFSEEHESLIREHSTLEQTLRNADFAAEMYLEYQPIIDLRTRCTVGFECLARWTSPVLGRVSPGSFIPVAEQAGLIGTITQVMLQKALEAAQLWPEDILLSFNVSPLDIASLEQTRRIIQIIQRSGIDPKRVAVELTETALLKSFNEVQTHMGMIRDAGAAIYLDDFGTGHSSLSYIHALPLDRVKIDRSFVQSLGTNRASRSIIRSVIGLCHDLDIQCVVEGVETAADLEQLAMLDAHLIQGYYFSKPLPEHAVALYLTTTQTRHASQLENLLGCLAGKHLRPELTLAHLQ